MKHSYRKLSFVISFMLFASLAVTGVCTASAATVTRLRCEYLVNPLGIQETAPRLSWIVESPRRGERQTAYEVLVASTPELLAKGQGDLWDSGKIETDDMAQVVYKGKPLESRAQCFWKIRIWDKDGKPSQWSEPAFWSIGLLKPEDWSAKWIDAAPIVSEAPATALSVIRQAVYRDISQNHNFQDVTKLLTEKAQAGPFSLKVNNDAFGVTLPSGSTKQLFIAFELAGHTEFKIFAENETFAFPEGLRKNNSYPYLRKAFAIDKPVRKAILYTTALGLYELNLNGKRVGDALMIPEYSDYITRVYYQAYDVTAMLKRGENALGALVAPGRYSGHAGNEKFQLYGKIPALLAQMEVTCEDGSVQRIVTDPTWKSHVSPLVFSDILWGEIYDSTREIAGWNEPGLDEKEWSSVQTREEASRPLVGQVMEPVRQLAELHPKAITEPQPGRWTFDLGQNMVGVVRLKVSAPPGTILTLRHGEWLNPDGTLYVKNTFHAPSLDTYVCKGKEVEIWQPKFTFHGFRYVELTGIPSKPTPDTVTGIVIGSDCPNVGDFSCSDARINQLQSNIQWTRRGDYLSIPMDCPQRGERLGWMGDAQVFARTATFNADVAAFFTKWIVDIDDGQTPSGIYPRVAPDRCPDRGTPAWSDAGVICPWTIYQAYGDTRILERHWSAMVKWVEWCRVNSKDLIYVVKDATDPLADPGDWLDVGGDTDKELIGTAYFAYSTNLMARAAQALGKNDEAAKYSQLFKDIKAAFIKKYVSPDGHIKSNTQCGYAMALKFDLLPKELRPKAAQYLEDDVKAKNWHLTTGLLGTGILLPALTESGKVDTAFRLLMQETYPSWLFQVKNDATTLWECWNSWPSGSSFNHTAWGTCGEWMFESLAGIGIDPENPGFRHIIIHPHAGGGITSARASVLTIRGKSASAWKVADGTFTLDCTVAVGSTATVILPVTDPKFVSEGGTPVDKVKDVTVQGVSNGDLTLKVSSGNYHFVCQRGDGSL